MSNIDTRLLPTWSAALEATRPAQSARTQRPDLRTLADRVIEYAERTWPGCDPMLVTWLEGGREQPFQHPADTTVSPALWAMLALAADSNEPVQGSLADGRPCAVTLVRPDPECSEMPGAVLVLRRAPPPGEMPALGQWAASLHERTQHALEREFLLRNVERLEQAERLQRALFAIADISASDMDMQAMLRGLHEIIRGLMYADNLFIALYDSPRDVLRFPYFVDTAEERWQDPNDERSLNSIEHSKTWHVLRHGVGLRGTHEQISEQVMGALHVHAAPSVDWMGVPMRDGPLVRGAVVVQSYDAQRPCYTAHDQAVLSFVAGHLLTALDRKQAHDDLRDQIRVRESTERQLQHQLHHDTLTGLPNRRYLREHLARALARIQREPHRRFALLLLDLDRFKVINDTAGEAAGDAVLKLVAGRFAACLRAPDVLVRLGADEFVALMEDVDHNEAPMRLAQRLIDALKEPLQIDDRRMQLSVRIGISMTDARHQDPDELLREANIALRRAKAAERAGFEMFDQVLHKHALEQLELEADLRRALLHHEFEPYFQPLVQLHDGAVTGFEALIRWNHPTRGVLAPGAFLQVATNSGLLEQMDWQMFERTCSLLPRLLRPDQYVNLNFSPRHFRFNDLDQRLLALLRTHSVAPSQLRVEVTEDTLMDNPERFGAMLDRLREVGIFTALDDFGTGYSSLGYLHRFRLHTVKIDRSFVNDLVPGVNSPASAVTEAILTLSRALGLEVVAEGIETQGQLDALKSLGCRIGQGYLFARPQSLSAILARPPERYGNS